MAYYYTTGDGQLYSTEDGTLLALYTLDLIFDRTQADYERWKELRGKKWYAMSEEERAEWLAPMKGSYNYTDMNRVEQAVLDLTNRLSADGYLFHPVVKTDWLVSDKPLRTDFDRYFSNVAVIRELLPVEVTTPMAPTTEQRLTYQMANDLEKILFDVKTLVDNLEQTWLYSNDIFLGEV